MGSVVEKSPNSGIPDVPTVPKMSANSFVAVSQQEKLKTKRRE